MCNLLDCKDSTVSNVHILLVLPGSNPLLFLDNSSDIGWSWEHAEDWLAEYRDHCHGN